MGADRSYPESQHLLGAGDAVQVVETDVAAALVNLVDPFSRHLVSSGRLLLCLVLSTGTPTALNAIIAIQLAQLLSGSDLQVQGNLLISINALS